MISGPRPIWEGFEPISLYSLLTSSLQGDPEPLLSACQSPDKELREAAQDELGRKVGKAFHTEDPRAAVQQYLLFMRWVAAVTEEYKYLADVGYQPSDWREVCGLWFNRLRPTYRTLWACHRAMYLALKELPPPAEAYLAMTSSEAEAQDLAHAEASSLSDRKVLAK